MTGRRVNTVITLGIKNDNSAEARITYNTIRIIDRCFFPIKYNTSRSGIFVVISTRERRKLLMKIKSNWTLSILAYRTSI
jgi:hypothetical protein